MFVELCYRKRIFFASKNYIYWTSKHRTKTPDRIMHGLVTMSLTLLTLISLAKAIIALERFDSWYTPSTPIALNHSKEKHSFCKCVSKSFVEKQAIHILSYPYIYNIPCSPLLFFSAISLSLLFFTFFPLLVLISMPRPLFPSIVSGRVIHVAKSPHVIHQRGNINR